MARDIASRLEANTYTCAVCTEVVGKREPVWSCPRCYVILHLQCVRDWAKSLVPKGDDGNPLDVDQDSFRWRCPGCQLWVPGIPRTVRCFCGKTSNPPSKPFLTPHACDKICGRSRGFGCPHPCNLPCHPGACPPCEVVGEPVKCACGKTAFSLRCGEDRTKQRVCKNVCDKPLECFKHRCTKTCHVGPCGECEETEVQSCFCGKVSDAERKCGTGTFDKDGKHRFGCGSVCDKKLSCGHHTCTKKCHAGECPPCARLPKKHSQTCACEKEISFKPQHKRKSCTDPIWSCGAVCGKKLECGHTCPNTCHDSPCPPCKVIVKRYCRCGLETRKIECKGTRDSKISSEIFCNRVCNLRLSCGRHRCTQVCCVAGALPKKAAMEHPVHKCTIECKKPLACGLHQCVYPCHLGKCPPCPKVLMEGISCACGHTKIPGPQRCGTEPPKCNQPCSRQRECGHRCRYTCHMEECPPCIELVTKTCAGGHCEMKNQTCHKPEPSCGRPCSKMRQCGVHKCTRPCHSGPCTKAKEMKRGPLSIREYCEMLQPKKKKKKPNEEAKDAAMPPKDGWDDDDDDDGTGPDHKERAMDGGGAAKEGKEEAKKEDDPAAAAEEEPLSPFVWSCGMACGALRECGHPCNAKCHPTHPCPKTRCKQKIMFQCECGRIQRPGMCGDRKKGNTSAVQLECDDTCARLERNRKLREALGLGADGKEKDSRASVPFPAILLSAISTLPSSLLTFLEKTEQALEEFVRDEEGSSTLWMPSMNAPKRWLVSCVAGPMGIQVESSQGVRGRGGSGRSVKLTKSFMSSRPMVRLSVAVRKYMADPNLVQTTPEDQLVHLRGLEASFTTGPELKSLLKRFETKANIFMLGEGRAVVSSTTAKAAAEVATLLKKRGLTAYTVPPAADVETGAFTGPPRNTRRRRKQQQEMDDEEFEQQPELADWHCPQCTLINKGSASACGVCQYERVVPPPTGRGPPGLEGVVSSGTSTKAQPLLRKAAKITVSNPWALLNTDHS
mmetsp:Transcript_21792/g.43766  ORF Transcript_21792/g.43766 Transcript_21792/m.43766 type:complete len:1009 (+) Transcript_21792:397-3423(+)